MQPTFFQRSNHNIRTTISILIILLVLTAGIFFIVKQGAQKNQAPVPSRAEEGWVGFEDTDPALNYEFPSCWEIKNRANTAPNHPEYRINYRGGTIHQNTNAGVGHRNCGKIAQGDYHTYNVNLDLTTKNIAFDQFRIGYRRWIYGPIENVIVDSQTIGTIYAHDSDFNYDYTVQPPYTSPTIPCSPHKISLGLNTASKNGVGWAFGLDFIDVHTCTPPSDNTPPATPSGFLTCQDNSCALSDSALATDSACLGKSPGSSCGGGTGGGDSTLNCQGNLHPSAKCFDCKIDNPASGSSQINILDFSCFAKDYGQNVGAK